MKEIKHCEYSFILFWEINRGKSRALAITKRKNETLGSLSQSVELSLP